MPKLNNVQMFLVDIIFTTIQDENAKEAFVDGFENNFYSLSDENFSLLTQKKRFQKAIRLGVHPDKESTISATWDKKDQPVLRKLVQLFSEYKASDLRRNLVALGCSIEEGGLVTSLEKIIEEFRKNSSVQFEELIPDNSKREKLLNQLFSFAESQIIPSIETRKKFTEIDQHDRKAGNSERKREKNVFISHEQYRLAFKFWQACFYDSKEIEKSLKDFLAYKLKDNESRLNIGAFNPSDYYYALVAAFKEVNISYSDIMNKMVKHPMQFKSMVSNYGEMFTDVAATNYLFLHNKMVILESLLPNVRDEKQTFDLDPRARQSFADSLLNCPKHFNFCTFTTFNNFLNKNEIKMFSERAQSLMEVLIDRNITLKIPNRSSGYNLTNYRQLQFITALKGWDSVIPGLANMECQSNFHSNIQPILVHIIEKSYFSKETILRLIKSKTTDVNQTSRDGRTPLLQAIEIYLRSGKTQYKEIITALINRGANLFHRHNSKTDILMTLDKALRSNDEKLQSEQKEKVKFILKLMGDKLSSKQEQQLSHGYPIMAKKEFKCILEKRKGMNSEVDKCITALINIIDAKTANRKSSGGKSGFERAIDDLKHMIKFGHLYKHDQSYYSLYEIEKILETDQGQYLKYLLCELDLCNLDSKELSLETDGNLKRNNVSSSGPRKKSGSSHYDALMNDILYSKELILRSDLYQSLRMKCGLSVTQKSINAPASLMPVERTSDEIKHDGQIVPINNSHQIALTQPKSRTTGHVAEFAESFQNEKETYVLVAKAVRFKSLITNYQKHLNAVSWRSLSKWVTGGLFGRKLEIVNTILSQDIKDNNDFSRVIHQLDGCVTQSRSWLPCFSGRVTGAKLVENLKKIHRTSAADEKSHHSQGKSSRDRKMR